MIKRFAIATAFIAPLLGAAFAAPTSGSDFLIDSYTAREQALGPMAFFTGLEGMFVNPASTTYSRVDRRGWEAGGSYRRLFDGISYTNLAFADYLSRSRGAFGVGLVYLDYGDVAAFDEQGNSAGSIRPFDAAALLNYSYILPAELGAGISAKFIHQKLASTSANNMAFDFGLKRHFQLGRNSLWLSSAVRNLGSNTRFIQSDLDSELEGEGSEGYESEGTPLPRTVEASISYELRSFLPRRLNLEIGPYASHFFNEFTSYGAGLELSYQLRGFVLQARSRYTMSDEGNQWATGGAIGYNLTNGAFDLSAGLEPIGDLGTSYLISLRFSKYVTVAKK